MIVFAGCTDRATRTESSSDTVVEDARRTLEQNPLFRGRSKLIRIDASDGQLVLEGRLPTYYLKQMLQTILRDFEGVEVIKNRVAVNEPEAE